MKRILAATLALTGCATPMADPNYLAQLESYRLTVVSQQSVEVARARAEEARYNALATIADRADPTSKQMAILALALSRSGDVAVVRPADVVLPRIPETQEDRALKWAAVIVPSVANIALAGFSYSLGRTQSNNQANTTIASYNALASFKPAPVDFTKIPPTSVVNTTTNTTTNTRTDTDLTNRDGNVIVGTGDVDNNRPVAIVPPVTVIPPVVQVVPVVTGP